MTLSYWQQLVSTGLLQEKTCAACMNYCLGTVKTAGSSGRCVMLVCLDITKAFDRASHGRLINNTESCGITDPLVSGLTSYLLFRNQLAQTNGYTFLHGPVSSGVIQGSVLGPPLFLLYVNHVLNIITRCALFLFADDNKTVYAFQSEDVDSAIPKIIQNPISLHNYASEWIINFSAEKFASFAICASYPQGCIKLEFELSPSTMRFVTRA